MLQGLSPRVRGNPVTRCGSYSGRGSIPACAGEPPHCSSHRRRWGVYPRVCGGTCSAARRCPPPSGLSPRVRGNPDLWATAQSDRGSIPACAGEPTWPSRPSRSPLVYPRVCGGTGSNNLDISFRVGLSPRVRGNPLKSMGFLDWPKVYPRVCGGTVHSPYVQSLVDGLSPRVRGNPIRPRSRSAGAGSIPACAGEPSRHAPKATASAVYPRVCGGTAKKAGIQSPPWGLSPRVRGNLRRFIRWSRSARSIPACAGEPASETHALAG